MSRAVEVTVRARFAAPPAAVFARISDHEHFLAGPRVRSCRVVQPGQSERNGLGAIREVHGLGLRFVEEITAWDPPHAYEYRVRQCTIPARHELGRLEVHADGAGGSDVLWRTRFAILVPVVGPVLSRMARPVFRTLFAGFLSAAGGTVR